MTSSSHSLLMSKEPANSNNPVFLLFIDFGLDAATLKLYHAICCNDL